jgi:hypothetical protein
VAHLLPPGPEVDTLDGRLRWKTPIIKTSAPVRKNLLCFIRYRFYLKDLNEYYYYKLYEKSGVIIHNILK